MRPSASVSPSPTIESPCQSSTRIPAAGRPGRGPPPLGIEHMRRHAHCGGTLRRKPGGLTAVLARDLRLARPCEAPARDRLDTADEQPVYAVRPCEDEPRDRVGRAAEL